MEFVDGDQLRRRRVEAGGQTGQRVVTLDRVGQRVIRQAAIAAASAAAGSSLAYTDRTAWPTSSAAVYFFGKLKKKCQFDIDPVGQTEKRNPATTLGNTIESLAFRCCTTSQEVLPKRMCVSFSFLGRVSIRPISLERASLPASLLLSERFLPSALPALPFS